MRSLGFSHFSKGRAGRLPILENRDGIICHPEKWLMHEVLNISRTLIQSTGTIRILNKKTIRLALIGIWGCVVAHNPPDSPIGKQATHRVNPPAGGAGSLYGTVEGIELLKRLTHNFHCLILSFLPLRGTLLSHHSPIPQAGGGKGKLCPVTLGLWSSF
jgi:hypothetical protein